jgi:hypothetical protein
MRRPLTQISLGIGVGGSLVALLFIGSFESTPTSLEAGMIAAYTVLMLLVCLSGVHRPHPPRAPSGVDAGPAS